MKQKLHDIYDVWHVPFWQRSCFFWTMCVLVIVILIVLIILIINNYRSRKKIMHITPWDAALQSLAELQQKKVTTIEQGSDLYGTLTHILKNYLHQIYGFAVTSKTDGELVEYLEQNNFDLLVLADIREIFEGSVYIKFAHVQVMQERIEKDLQRSVTFIKATIPVQTKK